MMGRRKQGQGQLFYEFRLDEAVPDDHLVRKIRAVLDLSWVYAELTPYYSEIGRPSIDPVVMIQMLIIGYVFAIRSEQQICREVQVNLAYRWFCDLGLEDSIPDHSAFSRARNSASERATFFRRVFECVVGSCIEAGLVGGEGFAVDASLNQICLPPDASFLTCGTTLVGRDRPLRLPRIGLMNVYPALQRPQHGCPSFMLYPMRRKPCRTLGGAFFGPPPS